MIATGHAHIDTAWLWPLQETVRKCTRTFASAVALMDADPGFRFSCSQAQQYAWIAEREPELFARIADKVAAGQWVPVGGMWVEPDMNLPSGESIVRQIVHGQRFFEAHFGVRCREVWIPDVFGYPAGLPQVFAAGGMRRFVTQKLSWNRTNRFPHSTFFWEGIDGTRVLTHFPPVDTYNAEVTPAELARATANFAEHAWSSWSLLPFGYGDGGGGPTREMLERARRLADLDGMPTVELGTAAGFFEQVEAEAARGRARARVAGRALLREPPRHPHQPAAHQARQQALRAAAPRARALDGDAGQRRARRAGLRCGRRCSRCSSTTSCRARRSPGSTPTPRPPTPASAPSSRRASRACLARARPGGAGAGQHRHPRPRRGGHRRRHSGRRRADPACCPMGAPRSGPGCPASGWRRRRRATGTERVVVTDRSMTNGRLAVAWDLHGNLRSVIDVGHARELLPAGRLGAVLELAPDHPVRYDAWDIEAWVRNAPEQLTGAESVDVVADGPLVGMVRVQRRFGPSSATITYILRAGSPRLDVHVELDWQHSEHLLSMAFPLDVRADTAMCGIQFGSVARPTHPSTSWDAAKFEVCAHRYVDVAEPAFGVAVLNDGRYGHALFDGAVRVSLARAARYPDPDPDKGRHESTISLFPHGPGRADVVAEAERLELPVRAVAGGGAAEVAPARRARHRRRRRGRRGQARRRRVRRSRRPAPRGVRGPGRGSASGPTGGSPPRHGATCSRSRPAASR